MSAPAQLTRRHLWIGLFAIAFAGVAIPVLRSGVEPEPEPPPPIVESDVGWRAMPMVYAIDFADASHGYALWGRCPSGPEYRCERRLLSTDDGHVWSEQPFESASLATPPRLTGQVVALGSGRVLLTDLENEARVYSDDAGRTWHDVPAAPGGSVSTIPPDGLLETFCVEPRADQVCPRGLAVTLPDSGHRAWLDGAPSLDRLSAGPHPDIDGSWWVSGTDPETGRWTVAASHDAGRTWASAALPVPPDVTIERIALAGNGRHRYALGTARRDGGFEPLTLAAIFHSTDGGRTWTHTRGAGRESPRSLGGIAVVKPDGSLVVAVDDVVGPSYVSVDGGRTFDPVADDPGITDIRRTRTGYLAVAVDEPAGHYRASPDGVTWTDVKLP